MALDADNYIGKQVGGEYRLTEKINCGAFGCVYKAQHIIFRNEPIVAIKLWRYPVTSDVERQLFVQEAQLLKLLTHPHILPILGAGMEGDLPYIVMQYASGGSLKDRLKQQSGQPLPLQEALTILTHVGDALHYAHNQPRTVVHRDLKPDNILFNARGEALLADFGLAVILTSSTRNVGYGGTPIYMAPEQFQGLASSKSDQYALGCIAYEMVAGRKPLDLEGAEMAAVWYQHTHVTPTSPQQHNPSLSHALARAILTSLAKDRTNRFKDVSTFITALSPQKTAYQWFMEGNGLMNAHQYLEAVKAFDKAIQLNPNFAEAYANKGMALKGLGRNDEALQTYEELIGLRPNDADAHYGKGNALRNLGKNAEAVKAFDKAIELKPDFVEAHLNKGIALAKEGEYKLALQAFDAAIHLRSNDALLHFNRGNVLFSLERYNEAAGAFETATRLKPNYAEAHHNKGNALELLGRKAEAVQAHQNAKELGFKG